MSAKCQQRTHALQYDRCKKKGRQRCGLSEIRSGIFDQAAIAADAFRFLRQPSRPNAPRPVAKSGSAAGSGVWANCSVIAQVPTASGASKPTIKPDTRIGGPAISKIGSGKIGGPLCATSVPRSMRPGKAKAGKRPLVPPNEKLTGDIGLGGMKRPVKIGSPGISAISNPPMTRLIVVSPNWNGTLKLAAPVKSVKIGGP